MILLLGTIFPWLIVGLGCWIGYHLMHQNGRILLRLDALEEHLRLRGTAPAPRPSRTAPSSPQGLPVGAPAPAFTLPDLEGTPQHLAQWQGRRLLLIFFNPTCGFCRQMAQELAALPLDTSPEHPLPVVVTTGEMTTNRTFMAEHGIRCPVLVQEQGEVASQYQAHGTPMGYLIDETGKIASPLTVGAQALLALAHTPYHTPAPAPTNGHPRPKGHRSLAGSRINRSGLSAGTLAPDFTLPRLEGGELALAEYRGQPVVLVFSDPHCGPCEQLLPQLEALHRRTPAVQVILISRRGVEENRQKVQKHGLTFPVVLQRSWEISRAYAMFGTPIGYLIDEEGRIAAEVAVGAEPILALLTQAAGGNGKSSTGEAGESVEPGKGSDGRKRVPVEAGGR